MAWSRPSGPPRVWNNIEITDTNKINRKFVIQEIPEEKYDEAVDHMCTIFLRDETILSCFKIAEDPVALSAMYKTWNFIVQQGISIAAYDITENPEKPILAGVNMLFFGNDKFEEALTAIEYEGNLKKLFTFVLGVCHEVDPRYTHGVDGYLGAFGLSVDPNYRRLGLGSTILKARDAIGEKYNIQYTSTIFTSEIAQKAAARCEFIVKMDRPYCNVLDEDGNKLFTTLDGKNFKIMEKEICKK
ncbi:hypothetical protein HCN44_003797 [Aphidius gifuensis]|uniref:N-acetyltransferase domain-containing protein n=1 Tax=Aphidius gifuensis TaxID=684658 RepID=A0A835CM20_APHGI|nr:uncharacterized protein LOC122858723 [Aphidius gifuensis]KAF7987934.1 hypothetical protein HCN44_003797 [Aphidius gifuensis]